MVPKERVRQRTVEQIVELLAPPICEETVDVVNDAPQQMEQECNVTNPVPQIVVEILGVNKIVPQETAQERISELIVE